MKKEDLQRILKECGYGLKKDRVTEIIEKPEDRERFEFELIYYYGGVGSERGEEILTEFFRYVLKQIKDNGLYEEFIRLGLLKENIGAFIRIIEVETELPTEIVREYVSENGFNSNAVTMIIATGDIDFIKEFAEKKKSKSNWYSIADLVAATGESTYIQSYIENDLSKHFPEYSKRKGIDENFLVKLIAATADDEYILRCLENPPLNIWIDSENRLRLILSIKDVDLVYSSLKKYLGESAIQMGIVRSRNPKLIKRFVKENFWDLYRKGLLAYTIGASSDLEYIEGWLKTNILTSAEKLEMLIETRNREYMLEAINHPEWNLEDRHRLVLAQMVKEDEIKRKLSQKYEVEGIEEKIDLPLEMKIGIEIESEGYFSRNFLGEIWNGWKGEEEGDEGLEVKSPTLTATEEDSKSIYKMCNALVDIGQEVSNLWGGHIHIGADFLTGTDSYVNLLKMWCVSEKILYLISNQENEITREGAIIGDGMCDGYAKPISKTVKEAIEDGIINLDTEQDLQDFIRQLKEAQEDRNLSINFLNIGKENKNTIEFRLPNATLSPKIWIENINLFGGIVKASEELAIIQRKPVVDRTEEEKGKLQLFERLLSGKLDEREILDILLTLTVKADKKQIYVSRYECNKKLMKENPDLEEKLDQGIEFGSI